MKQNKKYLENLVAVLNRRSRSKKFEVREILSFGTFFAFIITFAQDIIFATEYLKEILDLSERLFLRL